MTTKRLSLRRTDVCADYRVTSIKDVNSTARASAGGRHGCRPGQLVRLRHVTGVGARVGFVRQPMDLGV